MSGYKKKSVKDMCYMDDIFMKTAVYLDKRVPLEIAKAYLDIDEDEVADVELSGEVNQIGSKGIIGDMLIKFKDGGVTDLEIQGDKRQGTIDRALHNLMVLGAKSQRKGTRKVKLPSLGVIFIVGGRIKGSTHPVTSFTLMNENTKEALISPSIRVTIADVFYHGADKAGRMGMDLLEKDPLEIDNRVLREVAIRIKNGEAENIMINYSEEIYLSGKRDGKIEGREEGRIEGRIEGGQERGIFVAKNLLQTDFSDSRIASISGLSIEEVRDIRERSK